MDCNDEHVEEHDKYSFFLASALRNGDPEQFLTVYDSIIPADLPESLVEKIKERARDLVGLPDQQFHELALKARHFSLAQASDRTMSSASQTKDMSFSVEELRYIDDVEDDRDDDSSDDSRSPPRDSRHIAPLIGLLKPPDLDDDLDDDLDQPCSDSGVFNNSKATSINSEYETKDSDFDHSFFHYFETPEQTKNVPVVNNKPYDEEHCVVSDSGSQIDSPRSDISLSSVEGRSLEDVELKTFKRCHRTYDTFNSDHIHKNLYASNSSRNEFSSMKNEALEDYEGFSSSSLKEPLLGKDRKSPTRVDQSVNFPIFGSQSKGTSASDFTVRSDFFANKGSSTSRDFGRTDRSRPSQGLLRSSINSRSVDITSPSHDATFLFDSDDGKKKKKKKKGSKDDNDLPVGPRKERSHSEDISAASDFLSAQHYPWARELKQSSPASKSVPIQSSVMLEAKNLRKAKKKTNEDKIIKSEMMDGYIGDKSLEYILEALKEQDPKPKKADSSGQKEITSQNPVKADAKNAKNNKAEKKHKNNQILNPSVTASPHKDFNSNEQVRRSENVALKNQYAYVRLKDTVFPDRLSMIQANKLLECSELTEVVIENNVIKADNLPQDKVEKKSAETTSLRDSDSKSTRSSDDSGFSSDGLMSAELTLNNKTDYTCISENHVLNDISVEIESKTSGSNLLKGDLQDYSPISQIGIVKIDTDAKNNCDNLDPSEVKEDLMDTLSKSADYVPGDYYIFTDVEIPPVDHDAEFCPVIHKKKKRNTAKESTPIPFNNTGSSGGGYRSFFASRNNTVLPDCNVPYRNNDNRKFTRSVTPPPSTQLFENQKLRDLSPSAFPALRRSNVGKGKSATFEGRRNSTGDVSMEAVVIRSHDDSDIESVKSLPVASQTCESSPGGNRPTISYAKVAASPKPHSNTPLSPSFAETGELSAEDSTPTRQQTVWKGSVRERRHSLGSSPDAKGEDSKVAEGLRQKSGSQDLLFGDISPDKVPANKTVIVGRKLKPNNTNKSRLKGNSFAPNNRVTVGVNPGKTLITSEGSQFQVNNESSQQVRKETGHVESKIITTSISSKEVKVQGAASSEKTFKINSGSTSVIKLPPTNGKKFKQSVIFLDKRLEGPPKDLGITFGFEPDLENCQVQGNIEVSVEPVSVLNVLSTIPKAVSPDCEPSDPKPADKTPITDVNGNPLLSDQTFSQNSPLKNIANVHNSKNGGPLVDSVIEAGQYSFMSAEEKATSSSTATLTKPAKKSVCALSPVNGVVMPLVLEDKGSPTAVNSTEAQFTDSAIIYSSADLPCSLQPDHNLQPDSQLSLSSMAPSSMDTNQSPLVVVVYGDAIPSTIFTQTPSVDTTQTQLSSKCETEIITADKQTPQRVTHFKMEDNIKGKYNWEEASRFLKKEWDRILIQKERKPETVLVYSC